MPDFSVEIPKAVEAAARARLAAPVTTFAKPTVVVVNPFGTPPPHNIGVQYGGEGPSSESYSSRHGGGGGGGEDEFDEDGPRLKLPDVHVSHTPWWVYAALGYLMYKTLTRR